MSLADEGSRMIGALWDKVRETLNIGSGSEDDESTFDAFLNFLRTQTQVCFEKIHLTISVILSLRHL